MNKTTLSAIELREQLIKELYLDTPEADTIAGILLDLIDPAELPQMDQIMKGFYHNPEGEHLKMLAINALMEGHGVEQVQLLDEHETEGGVNPNFNIADHQCSVDYINRGYTYNINTGDTYNATLMIKEGDFYLTTLGDMIESVVKAAYIDLNSFDGATDAELESEQLKPLVFSSEIKPEQEKVYSVKFVALLNSGREDVMVKPNEQASIKAISGFDAINKLAEQFNKIEENAKAKGETASMTIKKMWLDLDETIKLLENEAAPDQQDFGL